MGLILLRGNDFCKWAQVGRRPVMVAVLAVAAKKPYTATRRQGMDSLETLRKIIAQKRDLAIDLQRKLTAGTRPGTAERRNR